MGTKCIMVLADGLVDEAAADLGGKTPLDVAATPTLDRMASEGILGLTRAIPRGMPPCRAAGLLAALGYDPARHWRGSAVFEAAGVGVAVGPEDVAFRCDLITCETRDDGVDIVVDAKGGRPTVEEGVAILADVARAVAREGLELYPVRGGRHVLVWRRGEARAETVAPAALVDRPLRDGYPAGPGADVLRAIVDGAQSVVTNHPTSRVRLLGGERAPTHAWPWGPSPGMTLPPHTKRYAFDGVLMAVDPLVRGMATLAGIPLAPIDPASSEGLPALVHAGLQALAQHPDLIIEVPTLRRPSAGRRVEAIERLDAEFLAPLVEALRADGGDWRMLVTGVHATPGVRGHADDPVPFVVATSGDAGRARPQKRGFREHDALELGIFVPEAYGLVDRLFRR